MSKKKATMTLKDFHGGSIPSDLRLPSAPGLMARPADRGSFDQQSPWGNSMGRSSQRLRPASAGSARNFDDKTPFLSHSAHIGRNFDEDERKPLDGLSGSRRTVTDESNRAPPSRVVEPKIDSLAGARVGSQLSSTPPSHLSSDTTVSSYAGNAGRHSEVHNMGSNIQNFRSAVAGSYSNPWGVKKEVAHVSDPVSASWSAPDVAVKLSHASAIEKVSSGRWHSQHVHPQKDVEAIGQSEPEREFHCRGKDMSNRNIYNGTNVLGGTDYHDIALAMHMERSLIAGDGIHNGGKETLSHDRVRSTMYTEMHGRNPSVNDKEFQPRSTTGVSGDTELQSPGTSETSERPKLKLLPRSKPLEDLELPLDYKQGRQRPSDPIHLRVDNELPRTAIPVEPGFTGSMVVNHAVERPKLRLKPCSLPLEQLEGNTEIKRNTVFAGARPREVVLKDRGIDGVAVNLYDSQPPSRINQDAPKMDPVSVQVTPAGYSEKAKKFLGDQRVARSSDRRDQRMDIERTDARRRNKGNESWRNYREIVKHDDLQPQQQERDLSPDTWCKPVESPKPDSTPAPEQRHGKVTSALELVQAFSRPVSDPTIADCLSGPQGIPSQSQISFSRLTG
ncbi:uncharacterized protein LOC111368726 [Olea europaea var. sylvestris]|uniref:uncharacterized protein LOC111368726 n=1 Tax=Olea europaea var. sylvestris TaxID=158386 RepID=UPI000C1D381A|nr:uncharacterized protein LOC111368726 [Olea europaea var. sylvestris]